MSCRRLGCEVTVLEVKDIPGGRMAEKLEGSFMKYTGATGLFRFYKDMWELIAELGLSERLMLYPKMGSGIASNTKETYELDFNQTFGMLKHPALSAASRLRLASLIPDFLRARSSVDPCLIHTAAAFDDENMAEYLTRKVGTDFLENVVAIVYRNLWAWNVEQASKAYFLMIYPHVRNRPSYTFKTGFGTLTGALAGKLDVRFNTKVEKIALGDDCEGRSVICEGPQGRYKLDADIVVCALPGNKVASVVADQTPWEKAFFADVPYAQYAMVAYVLKQKPAQEFDIRTFHTRAHRTPISFIKTFPGSERTGDPPRLWMVLAPDRQRHYLDGDGSNLDRVARHWAKQFYPSLEQDLKEVHEMHKVTSSRASHPARHARCAACCRPRRPGLRISITSAITSGTPPRAARSRSADARHARSSSTGCTECFSGLPGRARDAHIIGASTARSGGEIRRQDRADRGQPNILIPRARSALECARRQPEQAWRRAR
jgi:predicted NAD/FAD-dependent oxidoreductase